MRILHLTAHENTGAGRAALRLHQGLLNAGVDSILLTTQKVSTVSAVVEPRYRVRLIKDLQPIIVNAVIQKFWQPQQTVFSINATPSFLLRQIKSFQPDVINLHWIGWDFLKIEDLKQLNIPLVWTLHDMWPFTGGCHYSQDCDRYRQSCGQCPLLSSHKESDLSHWVWQRKAAAWRDLDLTIVSPSEWMADCARASALFGNRPIEVIAHGLNTHIYKPIDRRVARQALNLPLSKPLILFGAVRATDDPRKGFHLLQPALSKLLHLKQDGKIELVIFGSAESKTFTELGYPTHALGQLRDDLSLALAYSAADVMVVPSLQESFGQTASEALACGAPVVAFKTTGLIDIIDHQQDGYLAEPFEIDDFARGMAWVLDDIDRYQKMSEAARQKVEMKFTLELQAQRYQDLFRERLRA